MTSKQIAAKIEEILIKLGVNVRKVRVLGAYAHIDSFEKYHAKIVDAMSKAGFKLHMAGGGRHLDGVDGYRMVFVA